SSARHTRRFLREPFSRPRVGINARVGELVAIVTIGNMEVRMKRPLLHGLAVALLIGTAAACSQNAFEPVRVTTTEAVVTGCQKVGASAVNTATPENEVIGQPSSEARSKGANYVLVAKDGARVGVAYRCEMPSATASATH